MPPVHGAPAGKLAPPAKSNALLLTPANPPANPTLPGSGGSCVHLKYCGRESLANVVFAATSVYKVMRKNKYFFKLKL